MQISRPLFKTILILLASLVFSMSFAKAKDHDGEIVAYMQAINNAEINVSKVAKDKQVSKPVHDFADMMIDQHNQNLETVTKISDDNKITADDTKTVTTFKDQSAKQLDQISKLEDKKFQDAYVKAMINDHSKVNKLLAKFEKEAQNPALKEYLTKTKQAVQEHLKEAKDLQ